MNYQKIKIIFIFLSALQLNQQCNNNCQKCQQDIDLCVLIVLNIFLLKRKQHTFSIDIIKRIFIFFFVLVPKSIIGILDMFSLSVVANVEC